MYREKKEKKKRENRRTLTVCNRILISRLEYPAAMLCHTKILDIALQTNKEKRKKLLNVIMVVYVYVSESDKYQISSLFRYMVSRLIPMYIIYTPIAQVFSFLLIPSCTYSEMVM